MTAQVPRGAAGRVVGLLAGGADLGAPSRSCTSPPSPRRYRSASMGAQRRKEVHAMGNRLSKITTRTGDEGRTGLGDGSRVDKDSLRIAACGEVDELNSVLGRLLAYELPEDVAAVLEPVQHELFDLGAELAVPGHEALPEHAVKRLETALADLNEALPPLKEFVLPGGGPATAECHVVRAVCRRAERTLIALGRREPVGPGAAAYLNRLSDLLFVAARLLARREAGGERQWRALAEREPRGS